MNQKIKELISEFYKRYWENFIQIRNWKRKQEYKQLKLEIIQELKIKGFWNTFIAKVLNVHHSAITYTLKKDNQEWFNIQDLLYIKDLQFE